MNNGVPLIRQEDPDPQHKPCFFSMRVKWPTGRSRSRYSKSVLDGNDFTVAKINRSYRNGRRRRAMALIYSHAQRRARPKAAHLAEQARFDQPPRLRAQCRFRPKICGGSEFSFLPVGKWSLI